MEYGELAKLKQKECLGYLIPNYLIKKNIYKRLKNLANVNLLSDTECVFVEANENYSTIFLSKSTKFFYLCEFTYFVY